MKIKRVIQTIDTHTVGMPTRTVVSGLPFIPGNTMSEKMLYMKENMDWVRTLLLREPRGSNIMSGAILTNPCDPRADIGLLFMEGSWMPMCGHDTIGACTALVDTGMVEVTEPYTTLCIDTAAGLVEVKILVEDGEAKEVSFVNVPSFVLLHGAKVETDEFGTLTIDVAYGGNFYAILPAADVGLTIDLKHYDELVRVGLQLRNAINQQLTVRHPEKPFINGVNHVEFIGPAENPGNYNRNVVICLPGFCGRSPCGTGTSARTAQLYRNKEIGINEPFRHESMLGAHFTAKVVEETSVGGLPAVIPEISGRAYMMGMSTFMLEPDDPFPAGFTYMQQN